MNEAIVGIDVGKHELHAALLDGDRTASKQVENSAAGFRRLVSWIESHTLEPAHICLESTGGWSEGVATYLHKHRQLVSIVNPSRVKAFAQSEMLRTKKDRVDAALIARFCRAHDPKPWTPPSPENQALQALVRRHRGVINMRTEGKNRLQAPNGCKAVRASLKAMPQHLQTEIKNIETEIQTVIAASPALLKERELLTSIPGIADRTAACDLPPVWWTPS